MTTETKTIDDLIEKIESLGFTLVDTDEVGTLHYSRKTIVGAPVDSDGDKVFVFVSVSKVGECSMSIEAFNRNGRVTIDYTDIEVEFFFRNLKSIERQVVYAWRELAD